MKWRDVGTVYFEGTDYEVLHACPRCKALVCGGDVSEHDKWHAQLRQGPDPRLLDPHFEENR